jgi:hypothetical protein
VNLEVRSREEGGDSVSSQEHRLAERQTGRLAQPSALPRLGVMLLGDDKRQLRLQD